MPVIDLIRPELGRYLRKRMGQTEFHPGISRNKTLWIHAASVGEVKAAGILIKELLSENKKYNVVLTSMTEYGLRVAQSVLPAGTFCYLAPYDFPQAVRRLIRQIQPVLYIGYETELWPVLLTELRRASIPGVLLNGRMSGRSFRHYRIIRDTMGKLLKVFTRIAVIGEKDKQRFAFFGIPGERIQVTGNIKYDFVPENPEEVRNGYRQLLGLGEEKLFICGSTRSGEEEILFKVFEQIRKLTDHELIWLIAPRHLERLAEVTHLLAGYGLSYDLYSELKENRKQRKSSVIVVDIMGELDRIYSAGDYIFSGGSLVDKGGHNVMEAAMWGHPVYFGPYMDDFHDAAHLLKDAGAGFQVADGDELVRIMTDHLKNNEEYDLAGQKALAVVRQQQGSAGRQTDIVRKELLEQHQL